MTDEEKRGLEERVKILERHTKMLEERVKVLESQKGFGGEFNWGLVILPYCVLFIIIGIILLAKGVMVNDTPVGAGPLAFGFLFLLLDLTQLNKGGNLIPPKGRKDWYAFVFSIVIDVVITILTVIYF